MIVEWYKEHGYNFLGLSDHNIIQNREKWVTVTTNSFSRIAFEKYKQAYGPAVVTREKDGKTEARLKTLDEFAPLFNQAGQFLMIPSEEISAHYKELPIHINATNPREVIEARNGNSVYEVMQNNIDAILAQRQRTGQPMLAHVNHPNFHYAITPEDLMRVKGENFFEVYNGHPEVHNNGNTNHMGVEAMWDLMLATRLTALKMPLIYGTAVDDSHHYHAFSPKRSNSGRGWIVVRAAKLSAESIIRAMEEGDFYASSGVVLRNIIKRKNELTVEVEPEPGVDYSIRIIGTLNTSLALGPEKTMVLDRSKIGQMLQENKGTSATYRFAGSELYVRAVVTSSKTKTNSVVAGEMERAWVQPLTPGGR
jgi:hypothetical protein